MSRSKLAIELERMVAAGIIDEEAARQKLQDAALDVLASSPDADGDVEAVEEAAFEELRDLRRQEAEERAALVQAVRDDLLGGRIDRSAAIERVGLRGWSAICASLDDEALRRVLGGDL